jgi:hypothetical protein
METVGTVVHGKGPKMEYEAERSESGGYRFSVQTPPNPGTTLVLTNGGVTTFKGIGMAGMLVCQDRAGTESLLFPQQIDRLFVEGLPLGDADLTHL